MFGLSDTLYNLTICEKDVICVQASNCQHDLQESLLLTYMQSLTLKAARVTKVKSVKTVNEIYSGTFSETQGQIVGARESLNGRKNMARRKVKNGGKSLWGQCLTRPVPNDRRRSGFWLVPENFCVFLPNHKPAGLWVVSCNLTQNDPWMAVARHVSLGRSPRLCSRWKVPISAQNLRDFLRTLRENLTGEYAGPFAGIVTVAYFKVCEFFKTLTNSLMY